MEKMFYVGAWVVFTDPTLALIASSDELTIPLLRSGSYEALQEHIVENVTLPPDLPMLAASAYQAADMPYFVELTVLRSTDDPRKRLTVVLPEASFNGGVIDANPGELAAVGQDGTVRCGSRRAVLKAIEEDLRSYRPALKRLLRMPAERRARDRRLRARASRALDLGMKYERLRSLVDRLEGKRVAWTSF